MPEWFWPVSPVTARFDSDGVILRLPTELGADAHAQGIELDEASRVGLVVGTTIIVKGSDGLVKQAVCRVTGNRVHVAFVKL